MPVGPLRLLMKRRTFYAWRPNRNVPKTDTEGVVYFDSARLYLPSPRLSPTPTGLSSPATFSVTVRPRGGVERA